MFKDSGRKFCFSLFPTVNSCYVFFPIPPHPQVLYRSKIVLFFLYTDSFFPLVRNFRPSSLFYLLITRFTICRYIVAAQALVDEARGTLGERGWRTRDGEPASYDDISVFVIPLAKHSSIKLHAASQNTIKKFQHQGESFVKRYVARDEVEITIGNKKKQNLQPESLNQEGKMEVVEEAGAQILAPTEDNDGDVELVDSSRM